MRALLFQLVLAAAAVACNNSGDAPKVAASATAAAGRVIEVSGTVTVAGKQLARGDTVTADAIVETGADGSVAIELVHNHVRWELGANKHVRVRDSLAWGAPMRSEPGQQVEQDTISGGRPAERMAADTTTTAGGERERAAAPADNADTKAAKADKLDSETSDAKALDAPKPKSGGGLGVSGTGEGGGGTGGGTGLGGLGTVGHGAGTGTGQGYGTGSGSVRGGGHKTKAPSIRQGQAEITGRLAPEVVQRIVRQHFGQLKFCYEKALHDNPSLAGKVIVKFVINPTGAVSSAQDGGSTLGDQAVVACVAKAFMSFRFPEPDGGIVTVTYPIVFSPGE